MKKTFKGLSALLMTSVLAVSASAASVGSMTTWAVDNASITINTATGDTQTHLYKAYPIFTGDLASDGITLTNIKWGNGVNETTFITKLKDFDAAKTTPTAAITALTTSSSASDVAKALEGYADVEGLAKVFNQSGVLKGDGIELTKTVSGTTTTYTKNSLANGWYLIKDNIDLTGTNTDKVRSANLLQVRGNTAITPNPKYSVPTLEKKILEGSPATEVDANQVSIGDTVTYQIKVPVPDMTGYDKYYYVIDDTLSKGLTYGSITSVYIDNATPNNSTDDTTLTADSATTPSSTTNKYYAKVGTYDATTGTDIRIVFENCKDTFANKNGNIIITYTAILNDKAVITDAGNPNTAKLIYSNDPNADYSGDTDDKPDEPDSGQVTGETPPDTVKTYTTAIRIKKVDQDGRPLKGAKFKLTGEKLNKVVVSGASFAVSESGTYWKLKNGSYTTTDPASLTTLSAEEKAELYYDTTTKYAKTDTSTVQTKTSETDIEAYVDESGILTFTGLEAGTYTLSETDTPNGYNSIPNKTVTISNTANAKTAPDMTSANWVVKFDSDTATADADSAYPVQITNNKGIELPGTGGVGTTIFYIVGGLMISGALVLLIVKKRMNIKEK